MIKEIGIILSRTPYGTDSVILNILSASGINSGIRKGVSQNKKNVHPAETQVGAIVEYVLSPHSHSGTIPYIKEMTFLPTHPINVPLFPFRGAQKLFMCDITRVSIRGNIDDAPLYCLLEKYLSSLHDSQCDFLCMSYAYHLCEALGFKVNDSAQSDMYFDMCEGIFTPTLPSHKYYLTPQNSRLFFSLGKTPEENPTYTLSQWEKVWHILMTYYSLHVTDFHIPRSLSYLKEISRLEFFQ